MESYEKARQAITTAQRAMDVQRFNEYYKEIQDNKRYHAPRISRDVMFMEIARIVALRGTCDRAQVGAVLVSPNNKIISIGYNGSPHGEPHCDEVGHLLFNGHCIRTIHAEENCIDGIKFNSGVSHYTMYVTHYPCAKCQITLYEALRRDQANMLVIYGNGYGNPTFFEGLKEVNKVLQLSSFQEN